MTTDDNLIHFEIRCTVIIQFVILGKITKITFGGRAEGRRSLVMRGLSVILTLQPKFLDRFRSYVDL